MLQRRLTAFSSAVLVELCDLALLNRDTSALVDIHSYVKGRLFVLHKLPVSQMNSSIGGGTANWIAEAVQIHCG